MRSIIILSLISLIHIIGCKATEQNSKTFFDPRYEVTDRGALDVKLISQACSYKYEDALSAAKKNGKFHLRSVVGKRNHRIKFKKVGSYLKKGKICVKMSASSFPP